MAASKTAIDLDPATHTYRVDGVVFPSVTQILGEAGLIDTQWYTEESQYRGRKVHVMTALDDRGELDESAVTDEYRGYLDAWRKFRSETGCEILEIEKRVCNTTYRYAGTLDRIVHWRSENSVLDIKTGAVQAWHSVQLAAYLHCDTIVETGGYTVHLAANGTYRVRPASDDWPVFWAALNVANWKRNHGVTTNGRDLNSN